jgi:hypothetical protein
MIEKHYFFTVKYNSEEVYCNKFGRVYYAQLIMGDAAYRSKSLNTFKKNAYRIFLAFSAWRKFLEVNAD